MLRMTRSNVTLDKFAFNLADVARLTSLGRTAVYAAIRDKRLVARKVGRRTLVLADDLKAFLNSLPTATETRHGNSRVNFAQSEFIKSNSPERR
jgi:excisionase family DNA binding protein